MSWRTGNSPSINALARLKTTSTGSPPLPSAAPRPDSATRRRTVDSQTPYVPVSGQASAAFATSTNTAQLRDPLYIVPATVHRRELLTDSLTGKKSILPVATRKQASIGSAIRISPPTSPSSHSLTDENKESSSHTSLPTVSPSKKVEAPEDGCHVLPSAYTQTTLAPTSIDLVPERKDKNKILGFTAEIPGSLKYYKKGDTFPGPHQTNKSKKEGNVPPVIIRGQSIIVDSSEEEGTSNLAIRREQLEAQYHDLYAAGVYRIYDLVGDPYFYKYELAAKYVATANNDIDEKESSFEVSKLRSELEAAGYSKTAETYDKETQRKIDQIIDCFCNQPKFTDLPTQLAKKWKHNFGDIVATYGVTQYYFADLEADNRFTSHVENELDAYTSTNSIFNRKTYRQILHDASYIAMRDQRFARYKAQGAHTDKANTDLYDLIYLRGTRYEGICLSIAQAKTGEGCMPLYRQEDRYAAAIAATITSLPGFKLGSAKDKGDCFFDSVAQGLHAAGISISKDEGVNPCKKVRLLCDDYVRAKNKLPPADNWVKKAIAEDAKAKGQDYQTYIAALQFTQQEMEEEKKKVAFNGLATWGKPHIEGRILCETLGIKIHLINFVEHEGRLITTHKLIDATGVKDIAETDIKPDGSKYIHLANYCNHYVPLLPLVNTLTSQAQDFLYGNNKVKKLEICSLATHERVAVPLLATHKFKTHHAKQLRESNIAETKATTPFLPTFPSNLAEIQILTPLPASALTRAIQQAQPKKEAPAITPSYAPIEKLENSSESKALPLRQSSSAVTSSSLSSTHDPVAEVWRQKKDTITTGKSSASYGLSARCLAAKHPVSSPINIDTFDISTYDPDDLSTLRNVLRIMDAMLTRRSQPKGTTSLSAKELRELVGIMNQRTELATHIQRLEKQPADHSNPFLQNTV